MKSTSEEKIKSTAIVSKSTAQEASTSQAEDFLKKTEIFRRRAEETFLEEDHPT